MKRRIAVLVSLMMLVVGLAGVTSADSDSLEFFSKDKTITMINAWAAGSGIDAYAQEYIKIAQKYAESTFTIEYKSGNSGTVGMAYMKTQPKDGSVVLITGMSSEISIATGSAVDVTGDDYVGVALLAADQGTIAVPANSPFNTLDELIAYAKDHPGELTCAGSNTLSYHHFFALQLMKNAGIQFNYVAYKNNSETNVALLGGNADFGLASPSAFVAYNESGELRIIAQGFKERDMNVLPDVPTVYETPGLEFEKFGDEFMTTRMLIGPAGMTQEALDAWDALTVKVLEDPEWNEFVFNYGGVTKMKLSAETEEFSKGNLTHFAELFSTLVG